MSRTDRHTALELAGEAEMRRLEEQWPTSIGSLPHHRRAIHGRTQSQAWHAADYDPVQGYRNKPGMAWRIARIAALVLALLALSGLLLAWSV
jgi:hypothetical protein